MQQKQEISEIVSKLPDLWHDYSSKPTKPANHPFTEAIAAISRTTKREGTDWWNGAIDWLDANHPNWRGYEAPKVEREG